MAEVKKRLQTFVHSFKDAADEQKQAAIFWTRFYECYGIQPESATIYEHAVHKLNGARGRIDSFIPGLLIVEHKSKGKSLDIAYEQASDYFLALSAAERPKYIITSDFARFELHDLVTKASYKCTLSQLPSKASWFKFLLEGETAEIVEETPINREAAYAVSRIHEALLRANFKGHDLEIFLTRLLFCMFADDTSIFGENNMLRRLVENTRQDGADLGARLTELFDVFDQKLDDRQKKLDDDLAAFPYVNGALFTERARIPAFDSGLRDLLMECVVLDWSGISPAIFGAMFQGVLEAHDTDSKRQVTRRELGAHYTSERNILRVINPLFMDDLRAELESARRSKVRLQELYDKLPTITFFDPACGCGNFLVIAYRELRRLEIEVIDELFNFKHGKGLLDIATLCRVNVGQFYGIEIDDAAAHIARVAMYITDHQLNTEAAERFGNTRATVPLIASPHIVCGNALRIEWDSVLTAIKCSYVISNPPFVGAKFMDDGQRADTRLVFGEIESAGLLDLVAAWYVLATKYLAKNKETRCAFVSTNSIMQGEQVGVLWSWMLAHGMHIQFAHRTFKWSNEGKGNAAVHCVIVGFGVNDGVKKTIYEYTDISKEPTARSASNINPYIVDAPDVVLTRKSKPVCAVPEIGIGNKPIDGGNYLFTTAEKQDFIAHEPASERWFRRWLGAEEYLNGHERWCLWVKNCSPEALRAMPNVMKRVKAVRDLRLASKSAPTVRLANNPTHFHVEFVPDREYMVIPEVSSERRLYIPLGYLPPDVMASNKLRILPNAALWQFGILQSSMHMAWARAVSGRLKSDYQYSISIVYNNFVWPKDLTEGRIEAIDLAAKQILVVRDMYKDSTLADLYDPLAMPSDLQRAHEANNRAVDKAYGYKGADDDASRVAYLFRLYEELTNLLAGAEVKKVTRKKAA
jgi:hypothetical protein